MSFKKNLRMALESLDDAASVGEEVAAPAAEVETVESEAEYTPEPAPEVPADMTAEDALAKAEELQAEENTQGYEAEGEAAVGVIDEITSLQTVADRVEGTVEQPAEPLTPLETEVIELAVESMYRRLRVGIKAMNLAAEDYRSFNARTSDSSVSDVKDRTHAASVIAARVGAALKEAWKVVVEWLKKKIEQLKGFFKKFRAQTSLTLSALSKTNAELLENLKLTSRGKMEYRPRSRVVAENRFFDDLQVEGAFTPHLAELAVRNLTKLMREEPKQIYANAEKFLSESNVVSRSHDWNFKWSTSLTNHEVDTKNSKQLSTSDNLPGGEVFFVETPFVNGNPQHQLGVRTKIGLMYRRMSFLRDATQIVITKPEEVQRLLSTALVLMHEVEYDWETKIQSYLKQALQNAQRNGMENIDNARSRDFVHMGEVLSSGTTKLYSFCIKTVNAVTRVGRSTVADFHAA